MRGDRLATVAIPVTEPGLREAAEEVAVDLEGMGLFIRRAGVSVSSPSPSPSTSIPLAFDNALGALCTFGLTARAAALPATLLVIIGDGASLESGLLSFLSLSVAVVRRELARLVVDATLLATLLTEAPEDAGTGPFPARAVFLFSTFARSDCCVCVVCVVLVLITLPLSVVSSTRLKVGLSPVLVNGPRSTGTEPVADEVRRSSTGMPISGK